MISYRCPGCQQVLQVGAENAGRRAQCQECGTVSVIPSVQASPPRHKPRTPRPVRLEERSSRRDRRRDTPRPPTRTRKRDDDDLPEEARTEWTKVHTGLLLLSIGFWIMLGCVAVTHIGVLLQTIFMISLNMGAGARSAVNVFLRLGLILFILGMLPTLAGYGLSLFITNERGSRGFAAAALVFTALALLFHFAVILVPNLQNDAVLRMADNQFGEVLLMILFHVALAGGWLMHGLYLRSLAQRVSKKALTGVFPIVLASILAGYHVLWPLINFALVQAEISNLRVLLIFVALFYWVSVPLTIWLLIVLGLRTQAVKNLVPTEDE